MKPFIALLLLAQVLPAQTHEKIMIPIMIVGEVPGAFGSRFATELVLRNSGSRYVRVGSHPGLACAGTCPVPPAAPGTTHTLQYFPSVDGGGVFVYVDRPTDGEIYFNLRVKDLSRQALTWGTELPIVREGDTFTGSLELLQIPTDSRFRQTLRMYDFDGGKDKRVRLRIFPIHSSESLVDAVITLSEGRTGADANSRQFPGYAQVNSLAETYPAIKSHERVRVRIDSLSFQELRFWAFASITNNETQHVTLVTPQQTEN